MEEERLYAVPARNLSGLSEKIAKLNKRAVKLHVAPIEVVTDHVETVERTKTVDNEIQTYLEEVHYLRVTGETPKIAGWSFIATLDHTSESGVILRGVPGEAIPTEYREAKPEWCDHCRKNRKRIETFVVRHEDGRHAQVGRNCLVDFLGGADPKAIASWAESLAFLGDLLAAAEDEGWSGGGHVTELHLLKDFLVDVALAIRTDGWTSRGQAYNSNRQATADTAFDLLTDPKAWIENTKYGTIRVLYKLEPKDRETAAHALAWARREFLTENEDGELVIPDDASDFGHNVGVIVKGETVSRKSIGVAAWVVEGYKNSLAKEAERKIQAERGAKSEWTGTEGKRESFTLTFLSVKELASDWGTTYLQTFADESGNLVKWFGSDTLNHYQVGRELSREVQIGETVTVKATVKRHAAWNDIKETQVTRVSIEPTAEQLAAQKAWKKEEKQRSAYAAPVAVGGSR